MSLNLWKSSELGCPYAYFVHMGYIFVVVVLLGCKVGRPNGGENDLVAKQQIGKDPRFFN